MQLYKNTSTRSGLRSKCTIQTWKKWNQANAELFYVCEVWFHHTAPADDIPVSILTSVTVKSDHVIVARALTTDVTLDYLLSTRTTEPEAVAC